MSTAEITNELYIPVNLSDPIISGFISNYPESDQVGRLLEALYVGITALQSAVPHIDTSLVESRFKDFNQKIQVSFDKLQRDLEQKIKSTFDGEQSVINTTLGRYYDPKNGQLHKLIQDQIGVGSDFYKKLDPSNSGSVITSIQSSIAKIIEVNNKEILKQFSLDEDNSSINKLQSNLSKQFEEFFQKSVNSLSDIKTAIGVKSESAKGTSQGRDFEDVISDYLMKVSENSNFSVEYVGNKNGKSGRVGDFLLTFDESSAIPDYKIVVEAKNSDSYNLDKAKKELEQAKENREADIGIFIFKKGKEPVVINDFYRVGSDFFITLDDEAVVLGNKALFLDASIKIAILSAIALRQENTNSDIDIRSLENSITEISDQIKLLSQIKSKSSTIENNSRWIREIVTEMETKLSETINNIQQAIYKGDKI